MTEIWKLDLDTVEFTEKGLKAQGLIQSIGDAKNLEGLVSGFIQAGALIGGLGVTLFALKETMDLVFNAEEIRAVNEQFEMLSKNAGISSDVLKTGLEKASAGLLTETDLLRSANKALVEMGYSAKEFPAIMELARKATSAFGGDLQTNFDGLVQSISSGNVRMLKHMGIIVDINKADRDYAAILGITVASMSQQEKAQALLNAALEKGNTAFAGVNPNIKEATNLWTQFKVTMREVGETFALAFDKIAGPTVKALLKGLGDAALRTKDLLISSFGDGAEKSAAQTRVLKTEIGDLSKRIDTLTTSGQDHEMVFGKFGARAGMSLDQLKSKLMSLQKEYDTVSAQQAKTASASPGVAPTGETGVPQDKEKRIKEEVDFQKELHQLRDQAFRDNVQFYDSIEEVNKGDIQERLNIEADAQQKLNEIKTKYFGNSVEMTQRRAALELEIEEEKSNKLAKLDDELDDKRLKAMERYRDESENVGQGVGRAFQAGATKAKIGMVDFGARGDAVFKSFGTHSKQALLDFGAGTKSATDAAKGFFFDMLADQAEQQGEFMMLSSVWPPNPVAFGAGAALVVLAGFLRGQAGGGSSSSGGGGGGAGPGTAPSSDMSLTAGGGGALDQTKPDLAQTIPQKTVTFNFSGHYFDTTQTQTTLMDMMRQATDATDFKYVQLGSN